MRGGGGGRQNWLGLPFWITEGFGARAGAKTLRQNSWSSGVIRFLPKVERHRIRLKCIGTSCAHCMDKKLSHLKPELNFMEHSSMVPVRHVLRPYPDFSVRAHQAEEGGCCRVNALPLLSLSPASHGVLAGPASKLGELGGSWGNLGEVGGTTHQCASLAAPDAE